MPPQRSPGVASAEAVGPQGDIAAARRQVGPNAFRHRPHVVGGRHNGACGTRELRADKRGGGLEIPHAGLARRWRCAGLRLACQFAPAGDAEDLRGHAARRQRLGRLDDLGQNRAGAHQRHFFKCFMALVHVIA